MKPKRPTERERHIYQWKTLGKGLSWSRWCQMNGISVRSPSRRFYEAGGQKPRSRVCAPRQRVLLHKRPQGSTNDA